MLRKLMVVIYYLTSGINICYSQLITLIYVCVAQQSHLNRSLALLSKIT